MTPSDLALTMREDWLFLLKMDIFCVDGWFMLHINDRLARIESCRIVNAIIIVFVHESVSLSLLFFKS